MLFLCWAITLALIISFFLIRFAPHQLSGHGVRRLVLLMTILASAGTANLVYSLDESPDVKQPYWINTGLSSLGDAQHSSIEMAMAMREGGWR